MSLINPLRLNCGSDLKVLPAVANAADYPDPITALRRQSTSDSKTPVLPLLQTMQDPKFRPEANLATITPAKVNAAMGEVAGELHQAWKLWKGDQLGDKGEKESAQSRSFLKGDSPVTSNAKKEKEIEDKMKELEKRQEMERWKALKESLGQVDQLPYISSGDLGLTPQSLTSESNTDSPQIAGDSNEITDKGAASSNTLEARGIIIVGGKSDGTHFQTIDDTIKEFQNDPQPETVNLFLNQYAAIQDMTSTANESVQLFQEYLDSSIGNIFG